MGPRGTVDQKDRASPQSQLRLGGGVSANLRHHACRARKYQKRAAKLAETAQHIRDAADRRNLLDLAVIYRRAADQALPKQPPK